MSAGSATWNLNPTSNDWNTAENWTPQTIPDQLGDTATFDVSNVTSIVVSNYVDIGAIIFNPGASSYRISGEFALTGTGLSNNSAVTQNIDSTDSVVFGGNATAGDNVVYTADGNTTSPVFSAFVDQSNAGSATFINNGALAGEYPAALQFEDNSSAANSTIVNYGPQDSGSNGTFMAFVGHSSAGNSTITTFAGALLEIEEDSTMANATLIIDGGIVSIRARSTGGEGRVKLTNNGTFDLSPHIASTITIGSLEGDSGLVKMGAHPLSIGGNGLSTTFGGVISQAGPLVKTGSETLTLSGPNSYTGGTTISQGVLLVTNTTGSGTGIGKVQVDGGTFGGTGSVSGAVTVGNGTSGKAFLAPGVKGPGTLTITKSLTFNSNGNYNFELGLTRHPKADQVAANGVTIMSGARFKLRSKGTQTLTAGASFTVISNTSSGPISGTFSNLPDGGTVIAGTNTLLASYSGGDGNDLTLTVQ